MNWIRANKVLAVFLGFVLMGSAALAFLLVQAVGHYGEVTDAYNAQISQLKNLQAMVPYPDEQNIAKYKEEKKLLGDTIAALQQDISKFEYPMDPAMTPELFQDTLRTTVNAVAQKAGQLGPKVLPDKFALGFDRYLTATPNKTAAAPLGRQLKAIEFVVNEFLDSKVDSITSINRVPLPDETGQKPVKALVTKYPFDITFVTEQGRFRKIINDILSTTKQFYIIRLIQIKNQVDKSPVKAVAGAPAIDAAGAKGGLRYIFGGEKLVVSVRFEIADFAGSAEK